MGGAISPQRIRFVVFVIGLVAIVVILFRSAPLIWPMMQIFILAILLVLALDVPVHWLVSKGVPRWAATLNTLILLLVIIAALISYIIPPFLMQAKQFISAFPALWSSTLHTFGTLLSRYPSIERSVDVERFTASFLTGAAKWGVVARSVFATAFGAVAGIILTIVIVVYTLLDPWPLVYGVRGLFPASWWPTLDHIASLVVVRIRGWIAGTIILSIVVSILDYIALLFINVFFTEKMPFILLFAFLGGILEVIPVIGPIIAAVLPTLVGLAIDPLLGIIVLTAFFMIQQLEGHVLVPLVMHKAVRMHPVSLIIMLVVLSDIFGLFGAIIAVPVGSICKILYDEWYYPLLHQGKHPEPPPVELKMEAPAGRADGS